MVKISECAQVWQFTIEGRDSRKEGARDVVSVRQAPACLFCHDTGRLGLHDAVFVER